jgi:hypothetical protein
MTRLAAPTGSAACEFTGDRVDGGGEPAEQVTDLGLDNAQSWRGRAM